MLGIAGSSVPPWAYTATGISAGGSAAVGFLRLSAREDPAPALSGRRPVAAALPMLLGPTGEGVALCLPFAACAADMALAADRGACVGVGAGAGSGSGGTADGAAGGVAGGVSPSSTHASSGSPSTGAVCRDALRARAGQYIQSAMQKQNMTRMDHKASRCDTSARTISTALSVYLSVRGAIAFPSSTNQQRKLREHRMATDGQ